MLCNRNETELSPVIANLYMEYLEETALQTAPLHPRLQYGSDMSMTLLSFGHMEQRNCNVFMNTSTDSTLRLPLPLNKGRKGNWPFSMSSNQKPQRIDHISL